MDKCLSTIIWVRQFYLCLRRIFGQRNDLVTVCDDMSIRVVPCQMSDPNFLGSDIMTK